jgi:glutamine synthetase
MPKPIFGDNGTGMHVHQSLWRDNKPIFSGDGYAGLSQSALYYIGGILKHARTLNAFTNPTTNSYKRLVPGYEAPVILAYSARNRSAACRIPIGESPNEKRIEVRFPDPMANPYLAFTAMMMAGLDGIRHEIHPGDATDRNLFDQTLNVKNMPTVSRSLHQSLESLEVDHAFLLEGGVFTPDFLQSYMEMLWEDVFAFEHAPHPIEYKMYFAG